MISRKEYARLRVDTESVRSTNPLIRKGVCAMSIPAGKTSYFGRYTDKEKLRYINQSGLRIRLDPAGLGYSSCWDLNVSPKTGKIYFAPCHERGIGSQTRLVSYDYEKDESKIEVKLEDLTLPKERTLPHTKLHESISFMPDGTLLAATHSTDRPPHQPEWLPFAHVDHVWEGFPGSYMIHYDPETGDARNLGMPAPRESIYGGTYVAARDAYYMIGFMRGHVYRYSLKDKTVKDLGKAAEVFCYRLHEGPDHNVYGMTKSGFLFRINTETDELEDLNWRTPAVPDAYVNNTWYRYMIQGCNLNDHEMVFCGYGSEDMYLLDTNTLQVKDLGRRVPCDFVDDIQANKFTMNEFGMDKDGVLWYAMRGRLFDEPEDEFYHIQIPYILVRWDFRHEKEPEIMGILSSPDYFVSTVMCMTVDPIRDRLIAICNATKTGEEESKLAVLVLDLKSYRPNMRERGEICVSDLSPKPYTDEEMEKFREKQDKPRTWIGEEVSENNPIVAAPINRITPIRLWRAIPYTEIPESKVQKLAWDVDGSIHGICGDKKKYYFHIVPSPTECFASKEDADADQRVMVWRSILKSQINERMEDGVYKIDTPTSFAYKIDVCKPYDELNDCRKAWLEEHGLPGAVAELPEGIKLPETAGRRYLAVATATAKLPDGRIAVGTKDGMFCLVKGNKVFSMGNAAPMGPIRAMDVDCNGRLYGVAGDDEDMGTIFSFDEENGLIQMGIINYNSHGFMDGPTAANVLSSIAVSPDGKYLAVGGADRIGSVHIIAL